MRDLTVSERGRENIDERERRIEWKSLGGMVKLGDEDKAFGEKDHSPLPGYSA